VNRTGGFKGDQDSCVIFKDSCLGVGEWSIAMCRRSMECSRKAAGMSRVLPTQLQCEKEAHRRRQQ